ncbi:putative TOS1-like glycosyl hydrolase-domain-containing protein [Sordaria brevicollis]|uniref:glucan endo-1,3-beta-D-glucosidase n=1 Tax=Sordaria brevicollis TaxID=83679 RepID=A0AAE0PB28_SORBR|nr:putative TOS1-like glycosyl hydrolase-domain-containing protein [Sordaria brevicollis]
MIFNLKKVILASVAIVGAANAAAIATAGFNTTVSGLVARAHAGPDAASNNPHTVSPDADPFRTQTDSGDLCKGGSTDENGTHFCVQVDQVLYTKVSGRGSGTYEAISFMDNDSGRCDKTTRAFSGELAPFNEPVSLHFHGPLHLKQVAFYQPNGDGSYGRKGFYHAQSQTAEGITFMGNFGGGGSGVFTNAFGNSLSFVNSRGDGGASGPTILADTTVSDSADFSIFTDQSCSDGSCGYIRPGASSRKGFPGPNRMFLFEFSMPHSPPKTPDGKDTADKPAIWLLNARIPYTQQYGKCNCWDYGCGEFDIFEVVNSRDEKALSTFHLNPLGFGDPNWFKRPSDGPIKVAMFMDGSDGGRVSVKVLGRSDGARFGGNLSVGEVNEIKKRSGGLVSDYQINWPAI